MGKKVENPNHQVMSGAAPAEASKAHPIGVDEFRF